MPMPAAPGVGLDGGTISSGQRGSLFKSIINVNQCKSSDITSEISSDLTSNCLPRLHSPEATRATLRPWRCVCVQETLWIPADFHKKKMFGVWLFPRLRHPALQRSGMSTMPSMLGLRTHRRVQGPRHSHRHQHKAMISLLPLTC